MINLVDAARKASVGASLETLTTGKVKNPIAQLSNRELQIFIAIGAGISPTLASQRLGIAVKSFSTYRARVLEKLGLESNAEVAVLAYELKLVPSVLKRFEETSNEHAEGNGARDSEAP